MFNATGKAASHGITELRASDFEATDASSGPVETKAGGQAGGFLGQPRDAAPHADVPLSKRPVLWFLAPSTSQGAGKDFKYSRESKADAALPVAKRTLWQALLGIKPLPFVDVAGARSYLDGLTISRWKLIAATEVAPHLRQLREQYLQLQKWLVELGIARADWPRLEERSGPDETAFLKALTLYATECGIALAPPISRSELMLYLYLTGQYGTPGGIGVAVRREHGILHYLETGETFRGIQEFDRDYPVDKHDFTRVFALISNLDPHSGLPRFPVYGPMTGIHPLGTFGDWPQLAFPQTDPDPEDTRYVRERLELPAADQVTFDQLVEALRAEERQIREGKSKQADRFDNLDTRNRVFDNTRTLLGRSSCSCRSRKSEPLWTVAGPPASPCSGGGSAITWPPELRPCDGRRRHRAFAYRAANSARDMWIGPYQARACDLVLSVSVMIPMPTRAPGASPKARSKSARMSRS